MIAESIIFDDELITLITAGDEPLAHTDITESVQVTIPAGWFAIDTADDVFPVIMAEPEVRYSVAIGTETAFEGQFDAALLDLITVELTPENRDRVIDTMIDMLNDVGSFMILDKEASDVFPGDGTLLVRLVGDAELGGGLTMPVIVYTDLRSNGVAVVTIFGDTASALDTEDVLLDVVESVREAGSEDGAGGE